MNFFLDKKKINLNIIFIFILSLYYLIPYFLTGHLILKPHDLLDSEIVYNNIIGRIYKGDIESINLFIGGEIEWYFLRRVLQPLTLIYALFETETAFWLTDVLIKLISYFCFFKLSRKLNCSNFNSALLGCLYASSIDAWTHFGLGIATFPYLIYLLLKRKNINFKNYSLLAFIGLNTDLVGDILIIPLLFVIFLIFCPRNSKYNFEIFFKISLTLLFFIFLSNANLIYSIIFHGPFHRAEFIYEGIKLSTNIKNLILSFFAIPHGDSSVILQRLPFTFFILPTILIAFLSKNKTTYFLIFIIFLMSFIYFIVNTEFVASLRNNSEGLIGLFFKSIHWSYMMHLLPALYGLLFITILKSEIFKKGKFLIYLLIIMSLTMSQIRISIIPIGKYLISFNNLTLEQKTQLRKNFYDKKFNSMIQNIFEVTKEQENIFGQDFKSKYTFDGYYDYENYRYIKNLVLDSRILSIGLDPMVAVMNDIKVIDGYHNFYPLSYKLKFRKIIEEQLNHYHELKKYYDHWGGRVYTFVSEPRIIKINFRQAQLLGAEYVISKYQIFNKELIAICEKCNNSSELFLYKIKT